MTKTRFAVVGAGWISQEAFLPAVPQSGNAEVTTLVSGSPDGAQRLADFHGIAHVRSYDAFDAALTEDLFDAVYIALPNELHADYAIRAAQAGKHVLVEKPLAITEAECEAMIAAAEASGVWLMTAYRLHSEPGTVALLDQIRQGAIGDPRFFMSAFSFQSPPDNHRLKAAHWGGPLQDIGVYCLNAARHVFGAEPVEAMAMQGSTPGDPRFAEIEEAIAVTLRFPEGRLAQFTVSFGADMAENYTVVGSKGTLALDPGYRFENVMARTLSRASRELHHETAADVDHFAGMVAYFAECIQTGTRPEPDGEEGLADVRALRAIERAAQTGQPQAIATPPRPGHPVAAMVRTCPRTDKRLLL